MKQWLPPRKIKLSKPVYPDFISRWEGDGIVVSDYFMKLYKKSGLKGISAFNPLEVTEVNSLKKDPIRPPLYYDAIPVISNAQIDHRKSKIKGYKHEHKCLLCDPEGITVSTINSIYLNWIGWEGEDIFRLHELDSVDIRYTEL